MALAATAAAFGAGHTAANPAHYLPFAAIARSRGWGVGRALALAAACGAGHVLSSALVGGIGVALGAGIGSVEAAAEIRESAMRWLFLAFALAYFAVEVRASFAGRICLCCRGAAGRVENKGAGGAPAGFSDRANFWTLFLIFTLGPCEILAPLVMVPASEGDWAGVVSVAAAFSVSTVATMLAMTAAVMFGLGFVRGGGEFFQKWGRAISGGVVLACAVLLFFEK